MTLPISNKLTAMIAASAALTDVGLEGLDGTYDPYTGTPQDTEHISSVGRLVRGVIDQIFDEEGETHGPRTAMNRVNQWLRAMSAEIDQVSLLLGHADVAPDFGPRIPHRPDAP